VLPRNSLNYLLLLLLLSYAIKTIVGQPGNSRVKLGQTTVQLCKRAGFDNVGHRLGLTTGAQISVYKSFYNALDRCGNGSGETTVDMVG